MKGGIGASSHTEWLDLEYVQNIKSPKTDMYNIA